VRVYWEDTDAGGVVFYANYLKFFERARTEWLRARAWASRPARQTGAIFVVTDTQVSWCCNASLVVQLVMAGLLLAVAGQLDGDLRQAVRLRACAAATRPSSASSGRARA
jgi:acyl-CoA thioester hydrolase